MKKILIIDDEPEICDAVAEFLKEDGYETIVAHRGHEALDKTLKEKPDLLILDVALPDVDGTVVYETLRKIPETKEINVIFLTALASGAPQQFVGVDRAHYSLLSKPVEVEVLRQEVVRMIGKP